MISSRRFFITGFKVLTESERSPADFKILEAMKQSINLALLICMIFMAPSTFAQKKVDFPKEVNLVKMTDAGVAIVGTDDALYGIDETGKTVWKNEKLRKVESNRVEILSGSELVFVSDKGMGRNRVLNVRTGVELANPGKGSSSIFAARIIHGTNQLWVDNGGFKSKEINVWDIESNTHLYTLNSGQFHLDLNEMANYTSTFAGTQPLLYIGDNDAILHLSTAHLGRFNLNTGKAEWMFDWKPYKVKPDKGFMASQPSRGFANMKVDGESGILYFPFMDQLLAIDSKTGQSLWDPKKGGQTGKVRDMYLTDEGLLILTTKGIQLVNKKSGDFIWDKHIKVKGSDAAILIPGEDTFYTVSKGSIVKLDVASRTATPLTEKIKFDGGESFNSLEEMGDLIVMSSSQNVVAVNKNTGEIIHQTYLKAPGQGVVALAQNIALAAVAAAATMNSYNINTTGGNTTGGPSYHQYSASVMSAGGPATKTNGSIMFISTKFKDADANGFGIAKVDKKTGKIVDKIVIGDRDPVYDVNHKDKLIFYKAGKNSVEIKSIN